MTLLLSPARLSGAVTPPPSKSQAHRLLLAAALAPAGSRIHNLADSQDIAATRNCLAVLRESAEVPLLDCGESGSTLRFLIPVALAMHGAAYFTGSGRLLDRPLTAYEAMFSLRPATLPDGRRGIFADGGLRAGTFSLPGNVSSQFVTGLLFALPLLNGDSDVLLTSDLESRGYVDMTLDVLARFGVSVEEEHARRFHVRGGQRYHPTEATVEPDYSQAAFFCAANGIGNSVDIQNLPLNSKQGDRVIAAHQAALCGGGAVTLDVSQCPDLVPALAVHAALRDGETTHIVGAARLRIKESDRLHTVATQLNLLGADVTQTPDSLLIRGVSAFRGGRVSGCGDHRIAMMLGIAATRATGDVILDGAECVSKSYPDFWADYAMLGGSYKEV